MRTRRVNALIVVLAVLFVVALLLVDVRLGFVALLPMGVVGALWLIERWPRATQVALVVAVFASIALFSGLFFFSVRVPVTEYRVGYTGRFSRADEGWQLQHELVVPEPPEPISVDGLRQEPAVWLESARESLTSAGWSVTSRVDTALVAQRSTSVTTPSGWQQPARPWTSRRTSTFWLTA